jgi:hypothetical protein
MERTQRSSLERLELPGRVIQKAVGGDAESRSKSERMTMGFAHYSAESGAMEPHHHAEEIVYVLSAEDGWVRYGPASDELGEPVPLEAGTILHFPPLEWHVFEYAEGGYVDIIFFYGQVENIRPEEISGT